MKDDVEQVSYLPGSYGLNSFAMIVQDVRIILRPSYLLLGLMSLFFLLFSVFVPWLVYTGEAAASPIAKVGLCLLAPVLLYSLAIMWLRDARKRVVLNSAKGLVTFHAAGSVNREYRMDEIGSFWIETIERKTNRFTPYTAYQLVMGLKDGMHQILVETSYKVYLDRAVRELRNNFWPVLGNESKARVGSHE